MHFIAYVYHWDRSTLWLLSKSERQMWVEMIQEQKRAENNEINKNKDDTEFNDEDNEEEDIDEE